MASLSINWNWRAMRKLLFSLKNLHNGRCILFWSNFFIEKKVHHENMLFHLLIMICYQPYFQWHWFQHTYSDFRTITLTIRISPKEAFSGKKKIWHVVRIENIWWFVSNGNGYASLIIWKALVPLAFPKADNVLFADFIFIFIFCQSTIVEYMCN